MLSSFYARIYFPLRGKIKQLGEQTVAANKGRFQIVNEALSNVKYIKFSELEHYYVDRFEKHSYDFSNAVSQQFILNQIPKYAVELFVFGGLILFSTIAMLGELGPTGHEKNSIFPLIGAYALSAYRLQPAIQAIFNGIVSLRYGEVALKNLHDALRETSTKPKEHTDQTFENLELNDCLKIKNISFCYGRSSKKVLDNVSLRIPKNERIGLIGRTGAGKTTFINILLGLVQPNNGTLQVDNVILTKNNIHKWQSLVGYVPQDITLIDASIYENIAFGEELEQINFKLVHHCAGVAQIDKELFDDVRFDKIGESGAKLSGGQKQRIGIARALYKQPAVLILDEATSALDPETEFAVLNSISQVFGTVTVIMITHRHSTLSKCDQVYEIRDAKIIKGYSNG